MWVWEFLILVVTIGVVDKVLFIENRSPYLWHAVFLGLYALARLGLGIWPLCCGAVSLTALFLVLFVANLMKP